jgi:hypothetical protein
VEGVQVKHLVNHRGYKADPWSEHDRGDMTAVRTATTDSEGNFLIAGLPSKPGMLLLEKPGYARAALSGIASGDDVQTFELSREATIEGTVKNCEGEPVRGARLELSAGEHLFPEAVTDGAGRYRIEGLPGGEVRVKLSMKGCFSFGHAATLTAGEVTVLDFAEPRGSIAGRVTQGGKPLTGNSICAMRMDGSRDHTWASSGPEGRSMPGGSRRGASSRRSWTSLFPPPGRLPPYLPSARARR